MISTVPDVNQDWWLKITPPGLVAGHSWTICLPYLKANSDEIIHLFLRMNQLSKTNHNVTHLYLVGGWATPLKNMSSSVGSIIPNIWKNNPNVPNHQPDLKMILILGPSVILDPLVDLNDSRAHCRSTWSQPPLLRKSQSKSVPVETDVGLWHVYGRYHLAIWRS